MKNYFVNLVIAFAICFAIISIGQIVVITLGSFVFWEVLFADIDWAFWGRFNVVATTIWLCYGLLVDHQGFKKIEGIL